MLVFYTSLIETKEQKSKFELLYEKYYKLMLYIAIQVLQDQMEAEDAVHTACIKVIRNLDKVDEVESPRTKRFLLTIIKHTAIDMVRKRNGKETFLWKNWRNGSCRRNIKMDLHSCRKKTGSCWPSNICRSCTEMFFC